MRLGHPLAIALMLLVTASDAYPQPSPNPDDNTTTFGVDLGNRQIAISTGFTGVNLLVFGAISQGDVIVIIRGTPENYVIRKKNRVAGVWVNTDSLTLENLPSFYALASSEGALDQINLIERFHYDIDFNAIGHQLPDDPQTHAFYNAFTELKEEAGTYQFLPNAIQISRSGLFRVRIELPAHVPPGTYAVTALAVNDGVISHSFRTALTINKVGVSAEIYRIAHQFPALYGIFAVVFSVLAGIIASMVFRRK